MAGIERASKRPLWRIHCFVQVARLALGLASGGALWGLDSLRYVPPSFSIATLCLGVLSIFPRACLALSRFAHSLTRVAPRYVLPTLCAAAPALIARWLPDRTGFAGDMLQRLGVISAEALGTRFPQTMPLDTVLNQSMANHLARTVGVSLFDANRLLGSAILFMTGIAATVLARPAGAKGQRFALVGLTTTLSGMLFACIGSGRADSWMALLSVLFVGLAFRDFEVPSRLPLAEAVFVLGLFLHRAMLMMLPLLFLLLVRNVMGWGARDAPSAPTVRRLGALGLALVALTGVPKYWEVFTAFDTVRHLAPGGWSLDVVWRAVAPRQLLDIANTVLLVVPAAPLLIAALGLEARSTTPARVLPKLFAVLPWFVALLIAHPQQGLFRDFGVFGPLGAICGFLLGRQVVCGECGPWDRRLAVGVTLSLLAAMLAPLALWATPASSHARLVAFASDSLGQAAQHRADVWSFLMLTYERDSLPRQTFEIAGRVYELQPTARRRAQYVFAGARAGAYADVERVAAQSIRSRTAGTLEWLALTGAAAELGDSAAYLAGERTLHVLARDSAQRALMRDALRFCPQLWPTIPETTRIALMTHQLR